MAQLPSVFKTDDHEEMGGFDALPAGWYGAEVIKSEVKQTRAKTGKYLSLQFKILDEEYEGRLIFCNLNLVNPNPQAVEIAQRELKSICVACGIDGDLDDSVDLHNIPIGIKLTIKPATADYPEGNNIKGYCKQEDLPEDEDSPFQLI